MMIDFLSGWTIDLVIFIIVISFLEMILPKGNMRKFVKMTIGLIVIIVIINPFIKLVQGDIDIEAEVFKNIERQNNYRYQDNKEFELNQDEQIKGMYIDQIKKDIEVSVIDKTKYKLSEYHIEIDENKDMEQYGSIIKIELILTGKNDESSLKFENMNNIEDIKIDINIKDNVKDKENNQEEKISENSTKEIEEIKKMISERFKITKEKIFISLETEE